LKAIQLKLEANKPTGWPRTSKVLEDIKKRGRATKKSKQKDYEKEEATDEFCPSASMKWK
jgi:hypothetical protein